MTLNKNKILRTALLLPPFLLASCSSFNPSIKPETKNHSYNLNNASCDLPLLQAQNLFSELENLPAASNNNIEVLQDFNKLEIIIDNAYSKAQLQANTHPDETIRKQAEHCVQEFSALYTELGLSRKIYDSISKLELADESPETHRYLKKIIRDYHRSGVDKSEHARTRIKAIIDELTVLSQRFSKNIREDVRSLEVNSVDQLKGLPEDYIESHKKSSGKFVITTDYPDFFPVARYAENDKLRKDLYTLFKNRGYPQNESVLKNILNLRYELATLLDYPDFASFITEDKMIRHPDKAQSFIDEIATLVDSIADEDYEILLHRLKQIDPEAREVKSWQHSYISNLVRKESYDFDSRELRQYFIYRNVENGIFNLIEEMFSIQIITWETETWHKSVKAYKIISNGREIGRFFLDMHPRENKYKHAAHFPLVSGVNGVQLPVSVLVCNFPGENDPDSSFMEHGQVETFLHEFGHLIHHIFAGQQNWIGFSGVATERDFVEAPSQMLEEWIWDEKILKRFAINQEGKTIPDEIISRMQKARYFGEGLNIRNQLYYAALSLDYHRGNPESLDLNEAMIRLNKKYSKFDHMEGTYFYTNFGHLMGYSAMYYTYMWSLVIAADMFSEFEQQDLLSDEIANHYRQSILAPGGSRDAEQLVSDFLGRPYDFNAFKNRLKRH